jgi:hypothetical protein
VDDDVFASDAAAVPGISPTGIFNACQTVSSSGATATAIASDVGDAIALQVGVDVASNVVIMSPQARTFLRLLKVMDADGTLAGMPIIDTAPSGIFAIVACSHIGIAMDDTVRLAVSTDGDVEMTDTPSGSSVTPTASSSQKVSLFTTGAIAFRVGLHSDWVITGAEDSAGAKYAVVQIADASYA